MPNNSAFKPTAGGGFCFNQTLPAGSVLTRRWASQSAQRGAPTSQPALDYWRCMPEVTHDYPIEDLVQRARALSPQDRARIAEELLASLDEEPDSDAEAAWEQEIGRRVDEIKVGRAKLIPAEQVFAETARIYK
jgi:putative addiction module component (TIGR02574 family)